MSEIISDIINFAIRKKFYKKIPILYQALNNLVFVKISAPHGHKRFLGYHIV